MPRTHELSWTTMSNPRPILTIDAPVVHDAMQHPT
jgi:hypothetical protein